MPLAPHGRPSVLTAGAALGESRGVVIMLHGRGASPKDILSLVPSLEQPDFTYLAPAAANNTWYPYTFLSDLERNEPALSSALEVVADLIETVGERGVPRERIVLLGFSQGACLSTEFCVRNAARYGGLVAFSGGLIGPPGTTWDYAGSLESTPVFLGCSDVDAHIPLERVNETASVLARVGATVDKRIYPGMGHVVSQDEIAAARRILDTLR